MIQMRGQRLDGRAFKNQRGGQASRQAEIGTEAIAQFDGEQRVEAHLVQRPGRIWTIFTQAAEHTCHALAADSEAVKMNWPAFYQPRR